MKETIYATDKWPHKTLKCYSCSLEGTELKTVPAEEIIDDMGMYSPGQIYLLESIARSHDRSKHRGLGNLIVEVYERRAENSPGDGDN